jgi:hypothetical protein
VQSESGRNTSSPLYFFIDQGALIAAEVFGMSDRSHHISLSTLWNYSRHPIPATLSQSDWNHLSFCRDCTSALWLCNTAPSLEDVKETLKESGIPFE